MFGIIYKTTNLINGKVYIGQTTTDNPNYLGSGVLFQKAFNKYGKENFKRETLEICKSQEQLDSNEEYYIELFNSTNLEIGYNLSKKAFGIEKGYKFSKEHNLNISKATLGKPKHTEESKQKLREFRTGFKYSKESNKKRNEKLKNKKRNEETKNLLRISHLNKKYNNKNKKYKLLEEQVKNIIINLKEDLLTQKEIGKIYNIDASIISSIKNNCSHYNKLYNLYN